MRAVVTMVVSKAERKRQNHSPAMIMCSLAELIFATVAGMAVGLPSEFADIVSPYAISMKKGVVVMKPGRNPRSWKVAHHICTRSEPGKMDAQHTNSRWNESLDVTVGLTPAAR